MSKVKIVMFVILGLIVGQVFIITTKLAEIMVAIQALQ